jgi:hypothetical protein
MASNGGDYKQVPMDEDTIDTKRSPAATSRSAESSVPHSTGSLKIPYRIPYKPFSSLQTVLPIVSYCVASIMMTVVNKYCVSGRDFRMNFLLLTIQSAVCVACALMFKKLKLADFRDFDSNDAKKWFPVSFMLVSVIYTGSKSLVRLFVRFYSLSHPQIAISHHGCLHNIQKSDHYPHCK